MQNIIIRSANIDDAEKIADIKIEGWQTFYRRRNKKELS